MPSDRERPVYDEERLDRLPIELRAARKLAERERELRDELKALARRIKQTPDFPRFRPSKSARRRHLYLVDDESRTFSSGEDAA